MEAVAARVLVYALDDGAPLLEVSGPITGIPAIDVHEATRLRVGAPVLLYRERRARVRSNGFVDAGERLFYVAFDSDREGVVTLRKALTGAWLVDAQCLGGETADRLTARAAEALGTRRLASVALIWRGERVDWRRGFVPAGEEVLVYSVPEAECSTVEAVRRGMLRDFALVSEELRDVESVALELARSVAYSGGFATLPEVLRDNVALIREASSAGASPLRFVSEKLRADPAVVACCVRADPMAIQHAAPEIRHDLRFALLAVRGCGFALQHLPEELLRNREVALEAVRRDPAALRHIPDELLEEDDFRLRVARFSHAGERCLVERLARRGVRLPLGTRGRLLRSDVESARACLRPAYSTRHW
jgi:hypothetical protein